MQHLQSNTTLQGGKYKIERMLGQGGFGITYLAEQKSLDRCVVVKEFFMKDFCARDNTTRTVRIPTAGSRKQVEQYRKKFIKEARNLARLNHPHIISVIDVFEENDTVYYVMPYLSGGSLLDYVKTHGTLSEQEAMKYVKQIASALKYMHEERHICHYDVKPANILLDDKGNAVLIDFGISKNYDASGQETTTTPVGMSDGYAPIEQYQQKLEEFSPSSDVYGLGATLYFLLHGKRPVSAVLRASGTPLVTGKKISQSIKNLIFFSMEISKRDRAKNVDVFLEEVSTTNYKSHAVVQDDEEDTILEKTASSSNSGINSQETHNGNKSYIVWITGFMIFIVIGFFIYNRQGKPNSIVNIEDTLSNSNKYNEANIEDIIAEEAVSITNEKSEKEKNIKDSYLSIVESYTIGGDLDPNWWSPFYFLYDITRDGIPELWLIIKDSNVDTMDASLLVYTHNGEKVKFIYNGSIGHPYHNCLYKGNGYILRVLANMGAATWYKYVYRNGAIAEQESFSEELTESQEDYTQPSEPEVEKYELTNTAPINKIHIK